MAYKAINQANPALRPPAHPSEAILLYDRNQLKFYVILSFRLPKPYEGVDAKHTINFKRPNAEKGVLVALRL